MSPTAALETALVTGRVGAEIAPRSFLRNAESFWETPTCGNIATVPVPVHGPTTPTIRASACSLYPTGAKPVPVGG